MGMFANKNLNKAKVPGGGLYLEEGHHELSIVGWKGFVTRQKEAALVVDFRVLTSSNPDVKTGALRNFFAGENDDMFSGKVKGLLIAAGGLSDSEDSEKIAKTDFDELLEQSILHPELYIGNKLICDGVRVLKKAAKKEAKDDPTLLEDDAWVKRNSYVRLDFSYHPDTRAAIEAAKAKKAVTK